jgi:hypothetical protein
MTGNLEIVILFVPTLVVHPSMGTTQVPALCGINVRTEMAATVVRMPMETITPEIIGQAATTTMELGRLVTAQALLGLATKTPICVTAQIHNTYTGPMSHAWGVCEDC